MVLSHHTLPRLEYAASFSWERGEEFNRPLHNHPDWIEFLIITEGTGTCVIGGQTYHLAPNSVVVYNMGEWHEEYTDSHSRRQILCFGCTNLHIDGLPPGYFMSHDMPRVLPLQDDSDTLQNRFHALLAEVDNNHSRNAHIITDYLLAILLTEIGTVIEHKTTEFNGSRSSQLVAQAQNYIHNNYFRDFTLEELSKTVFSSSFHLSRVFKEHTGLSPIQYLINYRIEVAKRYLSTTHDTVEHVARSVGYANIAHFYSLFKRHVGVAPGAYRKSHQI